MRTSQAPPAVRLAQAHPDLRRKARRIELTRYGHAMAVPIPCNQDIAGGELLPMRSLGKPNQSFALLDGRLSFAHSDWAGYSVFEEAFTLGHVAGMALRV